MAPSPASSTPKESTTVCRMRRSVSCAGRRVAVAERLGDGATRTAGPTRVRMLASPTSNERCTLPDLARLGQQALDRELEVVDLLEGEVHALGDAADDQPHDGLEIAGQRRLEVDAFGLDRQRGSPMVPSPTTRS